MYINVTREDGGFNTIIKRCYQSTFSPFTLENIENDEFLTQSYLKHSDDVQQYFSKRAQDLLTIDISEATSYQKLLSFLSLQKGSEPGEFTKLNCGGKVTAWKDLKHVNKIESTKNGKISLLDYASTSEK
jgi:hypothetical protein